MAATSHKTEMLRWSLIRQISAGLADAHAALQRAEHGATVDRDAAINNIEAGEAVVVALLSGEADPHELAAQARAALSPSPFDQFAAPN